MQSVLVIYVEMKNPCLEEAKIVEFRCLSTSQTEKGEELPTMGDKIGYIAACIMLSNFRTVEAKRVNSR